MKLIVFKSGVIKNITEEEAEFILKTIGDSDIKNFSWIETGKNNNKRLFAVSEIAAIL